MEEKISKTTKKAPPNYKAIAKLSYERQSTRKKELEDTLNNFFDRKKLYLKSAIEHKNKVKSIQGKMRVSNGSPGGFDDPNFDAIESMNLD